MHKPFYKRSLLVLVLTLSTLPLVAQQAQKTAPPEKAVAVKKIEPPGNGACQKCHAEITNSYSLTAMAQASGPAIDQLIPTDFQHAVSGVHYRVYAESGAAMLGFERVDDPTVRGTRRLQYFIGSGHRGRTYLFSLDGFFFEAPINWYAQKKVWDTAPAFQQARTIPMNLPALPGCLACHTSNAQVPIHGTENKYDMPLFLHDGITCERCHGDNPAHLTDGHAPIVNPAKLLPQKRDAICMQCHLEGNVAIEQPNRKLADFRPGEDLSDFVHYFLYIDNDSQKLRALGQSEALWMSVCKTKSGDKMSCMSCHDPHSSPKPEQRVAFYRAKCLTCHEGAFAAKHHVEQPDCTSCHMPRTASADVAHTQATDHRILRIPLMPLQGLQAGEAVRLVRFPPQPEADASSVSTTAAATASAGDSRDLALAWESLAQGGNASGAVEAERYLRQAVVEHPDDPIVLDSLGFLAQRRGDVAAARGFYEHALRVDPTLIDAGANLGVIEARAGNTGRAVTLWAGEFDRAPGRSAIGLNLAHVYCDAGQFDKARGYVARVLQFNPDSPSAKAFQKQLAADPPLCRSR
jgi:predicted CXXCH cytochrome family protein